MRISKFLVSAFGFVAAVSLSAAEIPAEVASCTNFSKAARNVRDAFSEATGKAVAAGDVKTLGKLFDLLAKEPTDRSNYALWLKASQQLDEAAQSARRLKPAEQRDLLAEFLENGSTFGLNTGKLEKEGSVDLGAKFVEASEAVLLKRMPQTGLPVSLAIRRDLDLFAMKQKTGSVDAKLAWFAVIEKDAFGARPADRDGTNAVVNAINAMLRFRTDRREWKEALAAWKRLGAERAAFYPDFKRAELAARAAIAHGMDDDDGFEKCAAEMDALPLDKASLDMAESACSQIRGEGDGNRHRRLMKRFIDGRAKLEPAERMRVLERMFDFADSTGSSVRWTKIGTIEPLRAIWDEASKLAAENQGINMGRLPSKWASALSNTHHWQEALAFAEQGLANNRRPNAGIYMGIAKLALRAGDVAKFKSNYAIASTNAGFDRVYQVRENPSGNFGMLALAAMVDSKDLDDFAKRIKALRGDKDDTMWFQSLRGACFALYQTFDGDENSSRYISKLVEMSNELLWPEEKVEYTAVYWEDAPETAQAAVFADAFKKLKNENRMGRAGVWDSMNKSCDLARVKTTNEKPHLAADAEGCEAAVCACYDAKGVHFYYRLNDPDAWKAQAGLKDTLYFETTVQPGDEASWHWSLFSALKPERNVDVEWDSPQAGRKMASDYLKSDLYIAKDAYVIHVFEPWLICYNSIPSGKDDFWRVVGFARWGGKSPGALGGGTVHELGRGMKVRFDMSGNAEAAVRLGVIRAAAGEYRRFRKAWENADFWADLHMGDPAYYDAVVKPYLAELDTAADETEAADVDAATVKLLSERLKDFSDTRLMLDAKRAAYLKAKRFTAD